MSDTGLLEQIIDLKIERAATAIMAEVQKLGAAHNQLSQRVESLAADLTKRTAAEEQTKDEQIAALQKLLAEARPQPAGVVIPPAAGAQG